MTIDAAIARIRAYRIHRGWTKNRLATESGVAETVLRRMDEPDWSVTLGTLRRLEAVVPSSFVAPNRDDHSMAEIPSGFPSSVSLTAHSNHESENAS